MIVAARELVILMRKREELDAKEEALGAEIGRALFVCYGTKFSPDATMTFRYTDGGVRGFPLNATIAPYRTTFYGLYGRNAELDNEYPFNLPKIWLDRKDKIDVTMSVNFVSTNDITGRYMFFETAYGGQAWQGAGGNSGSVVVNKELEVVGVVVDVAEQPSVDVSAVAGTNVLRVGCRGVTIGPTNLAASWRRPRSSSR